MTPLVFLALWLAVGAIGGVWTTAREQKVVTLGDFIPSAIFGSLLGPLMIPAVLYTYKDVVLWRRKELITKEVNDAGSSQCQGSTDSISENK